MILPNRLSMICVGITALAIIAGAGVYLHASRVPPQSLPAQGGDAPNSAAADSPVEPSPPTGMEEAQREYLWQIEHHGNILSRGPNGFRALGEALAHANKE